MVMPIVDSRAEPLTTIARQRWLPALAAWLGCVLAFGLILQLATWWTLSREHAHAVDRLVDAVATGDTEHARKLADFLTSWSWTVAFPWLELAGFALVGLTVLALARAGSRWAAVALPFVFALVSTRELAFWQGGGMSPVPFGEMGGDMDWSPWTMLLDAPSFGVTGTVPAMLIGTTVQTLMLLIPLALTPRMTPRIGLSRVVQRLAVPAITVTGLGLYFSFVSMFTGLRTTAAALTLVSLSGLLSAADTSRWLRIPAAIVLPSVTVGLAFGDSADVWPGRVTLAVALTLACVGVTAWMEFTPAGTVDSPLALDEAWETSSR